jgi:retron-type reverse transcriptase
VLEGDIKACFDEISHDWLLQHVPMDKQLSGRGSRPVIGKRTNCFRPTQAHRKADSSLRYWPI